MKNFKKTTLSLLVAATLGLGAVSSVAFAESDPGRVTYSPTQAITMVSDKLQAAIDAQVAGGDAEAVTKLVKDAIDAVKEINANDKVARASSKARDVMKDARADIKDGKTQQGEQKLREAQKMVQDLKGLI